MTKPIYDAWLVDLDGTLYRPLPVKLAMAAELALLGPRTAPVLRIFRKEHESVRREPHPEVPPFEDQIARTAARTGRDASEIRELVMEWMVERPGRYLRRFRRDALVHEIRAFRSMGGKTAIVSDYPATSKLEALDVIDLFDVVVSSGEEASPRALKPDPAGYLSAAAALGVEPARALVIGDREDADGAAAARAGMAFRRV